MHRGVCKNVIASNADVRFLFNHDGIPLGRTAAGTLALQDGDKGLNITVQLDTRQSLSNDLAIAIERGDVNQMSVGFIVGRDKWSSDMNTRDIYDIKELFDVSAVTYPASPTTSIEIGQRMWDSMPIESRARVRRAWVVAAELRSGKMVSKSNAELLQGAFDSLATVDTDGLSRGAEHAASITQAKTNLGAILAKANPVSKDDDGTMSSSSGDNPNPSVRLDELITKYNEARDAKTAVEIRALLEANPELETDWAEEPDEVAQAKLNAALVQRQRRDRQNRADEERRRKLGLKK
jgi:HK97 family phage prohead protease